MINQAISTSAQTGEAVSVRNMQSTVRGNG